jgi:NADH-quinone oxidoreductase subunit N
MLSTERARSPRNGPKVAPKVALGLPDGRGLRDLDELAGYRGLGHAAPWRAALLALCLLSLAGLPPTGGFFGKLGLFRAAIRAGYPGLAVTGIVAAVVSVFFYLKVIVILYMHDPADGRRVPSAGASALAAGIVIFLLVLALGLAPEPLLGLARLAP